MMQRYSMLKLAAVPLLTASALLASGVVLADGATNDSIACYKWDQFPKERLNLGVRRGGPLSSPQDENVFGHPAQRTSGVHAKHVGVCGEDTAGAVEGAVVTAAATGARMGLHTMVSRGREARGNGRGRGETCRAVFLDCWSEENALTPQEWTCQGRNEFGTYLGESKLELVAIDTAPDDPLCEGFEDDDDFEDSNKGKGRSVASGTLGAQRPGKGRDHDDD
jgi:hypothetical protein